MAQGGINAALSENGDLVKGHAEDTLRGAYGLADKKAVEFMCNEAPGIIHWLDSIGVPFSRTDKNTIAQRKLGGSRFPRSCYSQDYTGLKILHTLFDTCNKLQIPFYNEKFLLKILKQDEQAVGIKVMDIKTSQIEHYYAKSVILATGGYSKVYGKYSTNAHGAYGEGILAAKNAGCRIEDMEFVQFHPTALKSSSILISESARGAGGYLVNEKGERFVDELTARDVVSRAINDQISAGHEVYLDIRHLGEEFVEENLPQERKLAKLYEGVDPVTDPVPIKPAAHYTIGGIKTNIHTQTDVQGLYACGECADARVHGANRLGGNSLLEACTFGKHSGIQAASYAKASEIAIQEETPSQEYIESILAKKGELNFYDVKDRLAESMMQQAGLIRDEDGLSKLLYSISAATANVHLFDIQDKSTTYNTNLTNYLEFLTAIEISKMVAEAALKRENSLGAHFRGDAA